MREINKLLAEIKGNIKTFEDSTTKFNTSITTFEENTEKFSKITMYVWKIGFLWGTVISSAVWLICYLV